MKKAVFVCLTSLFLMAGCSTVPQMPENFNKRTIETEHFSFLIFEKNIIPGQPIRFYIEDDGVPNPSNPMGSKLAQKDPSANVIYLSRPCQYINSMACSNPDIYGKARYNEEVVKEMQEMVSYLMRKYKAPSVELVGFGGGAPMALLLSVRVPNVSRVITIAGVLDTTVYTNHNDLPPLSDSLNPADDRNIISQMPQVHYVGGKDTVTTKRMAERFVARLQNPRSAVVKVVPGATHDNWETVQFDYY